MEGELGEIEVAKSLKYETQAAEVLGNLWHSSGEMIKIHGFYNPENAQYKSGSRLLEGESS